ncbi:MAG: outer membrane beta-barrel protein [Bacteroidota bacterium]
MAQGIDVLENGRPVIQVFSNLHHSRNEKGKTTEFQLIRSYLGYNLNYNDNFSAKVVFDVAPPNEESSLDYHAFMKEASLTYKKDKLVVKFGVIPMKQFLLIQDIWGYRYIMATFQDKNKFGPSNDLGLNIEYKFTDIISTDIALSNGEGFKRAQTDNKMRYGTGITLKPTEKLFFRLYGDIIPHLDTIQATASLFVAYHLKNNYTIGAESSYQKNNKFVDNHKIYGISIFGNYQFTEKIGVFSRYDILKSNIEEGQSNPWNNTENGSIYMIGLEFAPLEHVKFSLNGRYVSNEDRTVGKQTSVYLNVLYKF